MAWTRSRSFNSSGPDAREINGAVPSNLNAVLDYSEGMGPTLIENSGSLDEITGVCGQPIDWNGDGDHMDKNVSEDLDNDGITDAEENGIDLKLKP